MTKKHTRRGFTQYEKLFPVLLAGKVREAGKGVVKKETLFDTPPSPLRGTSPAGGEGNNGFTQENVNKNCHSRKALSGIYNACCCKTEEKALLNRYVEDPRQKPSGMTPLFNTPLPRPTAVIPQRGKGFLTPPYGPAGHFPRKGDRPYGTTAAYLPQGGQKTAHGFTLIELLVVVLIIGILAAVALPQYNKAVNKAKVTEVLNAIDALDKSLTAYYLEHGSYGNSEANGPVTADELPIKVPALKYFHYDRGSAEFQSGSTGPIPQYQDFYNVAMYFFQNIGTGGLWIDASWKDGKQTRKACSSTLATEHPQCADFFPQCAAATKNLQLGCKDWTSFCRL